MRDKDPLGIYKAIRLAREAGQQPISKDDYVDWVSHPVTQRLHQEIAISATESLLASDDQLERHAAKTLLQFIDWQPAELNKDE